MLHPTIELLAAIRVVFLTPNSLTLCGIPYEMREGQEPRHLWKAAKEHKPYRVGDYHAPCVDWTDGWVYLGEPGWFGAMTREEIVLAKAFIARLEADGLMPGNAYEWSRLPNGWSEPPLCDDDYACATFPKCKCHEMHPCTMSAYERLERSGDAY